MLPTAELQLASIVFAESERCHRSILEVNCKAIQYDRSGHSSITTFHEHSMECLSQLLHGLPVQQPHFAFISCRIWFFSNLNTAFVKDQNASRINSSHFLTRRVQDAKVVVLVLGGLVRDGSAQLCERVEMKYHWWCTCTAMGEPSCWRSWSRSCRK